MKSLNPKQTALAWGEDLHAKFTVNSKGNYAVLSMSKWDVTASVKVDNRFFENAETDYRENAIKYLYATFVSASAGVSYGDFKEYEPLPAPHELSVEDLEIENHVDMLQRLAKEAADDAEEEHTTLAPPDLQNMNVADAKEVISQVQSPEVLVTLKHQERDGKNRKGVLDALDAALESFVD